MAVKIILAGDKDSAANAVPFGRGLLRVLHNFLSFRNLKQGRRVYTFSDGSIITVSSIFNIDTVDIFRPVAAGIIGDVKGVEDVELKEIPLEGCWCSCCFSQGIIMERILPSEEGCFPGGTESYPSCVESDFGNYAGDRYKVNVCQTTDEESEDRLFICMPLDNAVYAVDDEVILLFMGSWNADTGIQSTPNCQGCSCVDDEACGAFNLRDKSLDQITDAPDAIYSIISMKITGVNSD